MKHTFIISAIIVLLITGCQKDIEVPNSEPGSSANSLWLVDTNKMTGTSIIDVFPLVTKPVYAQANELDYSGLTDRVIVFKIDETVFIYPYWMMWVEVVNDKINETYFAVTYCPKTQTTYVIDRELNEKIYTFRASGLLYQDNLVYYDIETESLWSQLLFKSIHGAHINSSPKYIDSFETTFENAQNSFPDAKVFIDFEINNKFFDQNTLKTEPESWNLIMGIPEDESKPGVLSVINYSLLDLNGLINYEDFLIVYNKDYMYINAFIADKDLSFSFIDDFPVVLIDNEGNKWDVFGIATEGPRKGQQLEITISYLAYWWAWHDIFKQFLFI